MAFFICLLLFLIVWIVFKLRAEVLYDELKAEVLNKLGYSSWEIASYIDDTINVKSHQMLDKYDKTRFFAENKDKLSEAETVIERKNRISTQLNEFLEKGEYETKSQYDRLVPIIKAVMKNAEAYRVKVVYETPSGRTRYSKELFVTESDIAKFKNDPTLLMTKGEYNRYLKEQRKAVLDKKHHEYYDRVNAVIDYANQNRELFTVRGSQDKVDNLISQLFDRTVNSIKKVKSVDSEEWEIIEDFVAHIEKQIESIVVTNQMLIEYYGSEDFRKVKESCEALMSSQREFNEYIAEKVESVSKLFGTKVIRNETIHDDEYNYIRPYKKTITPFTAEVSANVFASAENNPLEYVVKNFYPNKAKYPEQIQKLYSLVEELETLRDAKQIIENYKAEYQQYLGDVPEFVMEFDEAGFYSRLGFAIIDESVLAVEYQFSYTSNGGMAKRSFGVPMTEETIADLIALLESKLTATAFVKEQRTLMTKKLRDLIKERDNYTCCNCGNSTNVEPNLLLEIDHIVPVSKGGRTVEENLQTLCWKCNRTKSNKLVES